jgi:hypothetical protein
MQDHVARRHLERSDIRAVEELCLAEAFHLNMTDQVVASQPVEAAVLDGGGVEVDVAVEVRNSEGIGPSVGPLVRWVLMPRDGDSRMGQLHDERVVDRHEGVPDALADRRQEAGVDRRDPESGFALP